ncbi:polysaccharide deacetylase [Arthrobacter gyeryongensis]|uniref:Polysaccharide deacetylase n=1 Tax=Arthrobacter gyeryongensis TaxID=1650592 RepID=A0ABP8VAE7_9MICC
MTEADARRLTVCLSFDVDAMSGWINKTDNAAMISRGEFGAFAIPRILSLLDRHGAKATFFVPGHTALAYPETVRSIAKADHEIGHHGWVHENPATFDRDGENKILQRGIDALAEVAGVRPIGYRAPSGQFSPDTVDLLIKAGFRYESTLAATDFWPYYVRNGDVVSKTEPFVFGEPSELIEIPIAWALDDFPLFELTPGSASPQHTPSEVREIWQTEFDYAYANAPGGVMTIIMHPQVIGRGSRLNMLDGLLEHMASHPGVVFESMETVETRWRSENPLDAYLQNGGPLPR